MFFPKVKIDNFFNDINPFFVFYPDNKNDRGTGPLLSTGELLFIAENRKS